MSDNVVIGVNFRRKQESEKPDSFIDLIEQGYSYLSDSEAIEYTIKILGITAAKCRTTDADLLREIIKCKSGEGEA